MTGCFANADTFKSESHSRFGKFDLATTSGSKGIKVSVCLDLGWCERVNKKRKNDF